MSWSRSPGQYLGWASLAGGGTVPLGVHLRKLMLDIVVGARAGGVLFSLCSEPNLEGVVEPRDSIVRRFLVNSPKSLAMMDDGSEPVPFSIDTVSASEAVVEGRVLMPWIREANLRLTVEFMVLCRCRVDQASGQMRLLDRRCPGNVAKYTLVDCNLRLPQIRYSITGDKSSLCASKMVKWC